MTAGQFRVGRKHFEHAQHPYAVILSCSDSRVGPEILFKCRSRRFVRRSEWLGILSIPDVMACLGSLEYAVEELRVPLIVVLGHEGCGAVKAAIRVWLRKRWNCLEQLQCSPRRFSPSVEAMTRTSADNLLPRGSPGEH